MGGLFSSPEVPSMPTPTPPPPAAAPSIDAARAKTYAADSGQAARGRAANMLTSSTGDLTETKTATKQLLGG